MPSRRGAADGLATTVEVAQAARQLAEARFNLARANGDEHSGYHALIASMGVSPMARINVMDNNSNPLPVSSAQTVERLVTDAMSDRPDVIAALGRVHSAEAKLAEARADFVRPSRSKRRVLRIWAKSA